ncbi:MAG: ParB N-terminal domain-containing protein [Steroidobacteraceae bacterium]|jgi:ParB family protein of integrating conjugative element (PFGI_1 class)|nr:ParB N-terminal domain-containing protein [Steroidobacteraceae bacterium]
MSGKVSLDERRRLVAESLQVGNPGNNARDLAGQGDPRTESQIELSIEEIRPYENNPRRAANAKFEDIKESIRTSGLRSPLTVTRRPGESHFIVEAGGNTRLLALRQLWAETRDPRFRKLVVLFRPWRSESHVLTAHLIENEQRGEMTFWDKACGIVELKSRLEAEQGRTLTLRPLEDALHALGLAVNTATLGLHLFATERLRALGEAVADLSGLDVKTMQPRLNALKRYAQSRSSISEDDLYAQVFEPVFRRIAQQYPHTGTFSVASTCEACEVALAYQLGEPVESLRLALRSKGDRESQVNPSAPVAGSSADGDGTEADELLTRARRFADAVGIAGVVHPEPQAAAGLRIATLTDGDAEDPSRHRGWCLLAGLLGELESNAAPPSAPAPAFLQWLVDPDDPSATAFWELLACARRSAGLRRQPGAASDAPSSSEAA